MHMPEDLRPGDRVFFPGFRDLALGQSTGDIYQRPARFVRKLTYRRELYEFKFDHGGYVEHWDRISTLYALNGIVTPTTYCPRDCTPEQYVNVVKTGRRGG